MRRRRAVRQLVLRRRARDELRHDGEIEDVGVRGTDRRGERFRLLAGRRARERRTANIRELAYQRVDQRPKRACLQRLRVTPRLCDEAHWEPRIAIDDFAVDRHRLAGLGQHLDDRLVGASAEPLDRGRP